MKQLVLLLCCSISSCYAGVWQDLWHRPDQQAYQLLQRGEPAAAQEKFNNKAWKATAAYKAKHYQQAVENFAAQDTPDSWYNRGNALAHLQQYQQAIAAYNKALKMNPHDLDAQHNKAIVKKLLQQQKQQQQDQNQQQQNKQQAQNQQQQQDQQQSQQQSQGTQQDQQQNSQQQAQNQQQQQNQQPSRGEQQPEQQQAQHGQHQQTKGKQQNQQQAQAQQRQQAARQPALQDQPLSQSDKQALSRIPDDPGGLLRQKFMRDYQRRMQ